WLKNELAESLSKHKKCTAGLWWLKNELVEPLSKRKKCTTGLVGEKTALLAVAASARNVQWILMFLRFCEKWKMN
ncbi:hypothetical protein IC917_001545, partial [Salmonella enterica]|nr:hypothetical protein [Salmonella enterica]